MRLFAPNIPKLERKRAVDRLIRALNDQDYKVRTDAALALGRLGDHRAIHALSDPSNLCNIFTHWAPAYALGMINDVAAIDVLISALRTTTTTQRGVAVPDTNVSSVLAKTGNARARFYLTLWESAVNRRHLPKSILETERLFEAALEALGHPDAGIRSHAVEALGICADPRALEHIIRARGDKDWRTRLYAARALGRSADARAVQLLIASLRDDDQTIVRLESAKALGEIATVEAVQPLIDALNTSDKVGGWDGMKVISEALGKIDDGRARYYSALLRWETLDASRHVDALKFGVEALRHPLIVLRIRAAEALGILKDRRAVSALVDALDAKEDHAVVANAVRALGEIRDRAAVKVIISVLIDRSYPACHHTEYDKSFVCNPRPSAAHALGQLGDSAAVPFLIDIIREETDYCLVRESCWALGNLGDRSSIEHIVAVRARGYASDTVDQALTRLAAEQSSDGQD